MVAQNTPEVTPWEHLKVIIKGSPGEEINLSQMLNVLTFELGRRLAEWILVGLGDEMHNKEALASSYLECIMKHSMMIQDIIHNSVDEMRKDLINGNAVLGTKENLAKEKKSKKDKGKKKGKKKRKDK